jgi:hypothetical protein
MISEREQALQIANMWLDFKMNALTQMVRGDPDCDACVLARQFIRVSEELAALKNPPATQHLRLVAPFELIKGA